MWGNDIVGHIVGHIVGPWAMRIGAVVKPFQPKINGAAGAGVLPSIEPASEWPNQAGVEFIFQR